jgi:DNA-binding HxlR family transcriptional regulator
MPGRPNGERAGLRDAPRQCTGEYAGTSSNGWPAESVATPIQQQRSPAHRQWTPLARALTAAGDHWTLLITLQLARGAMRLTTLQTRLPGISAGVLDRHLQRMVRLGLLLRRRLREMPPRVEFELTESGRELLPIVGALARWGMRHAWSEPRERERVDVEALLRLLPVLVEDTSLPGGALELRLARPGQTLRHLYDTHEGRLEPVEENRTPIPWSSVEGDEQAWIAALGPTCDYSRLRFTGEEQYAKRILDARIGAAGA